MRSSLQNRPSLNPMYTRVTSHPSQKLHHRAQRALSVMSLLLLTGSLGVGCEVDEEMIEMTCAAAPMCGENQREVDACEEGDTSCQAVTLCEVTIFCQEEAMMTCTRAPACTADSIQLDSCDGASPDCYEVTDCEQTIYCDPIPVEEPWCDAPPVCQPDERMVYSCEGIEDRCTTYDFGCAGEISCERVRCEEPPVCPDTMTQVESCEEAGLECIEVFSDGCDQPVYCRESDISCEAYPSCGEGELESYGDENACVDDGSSCREETLCGATIYCRPAREVALLYCEEPIADPISIDSARVEADQLFFSLTLSGGCGFHLFPGCFSEFQESAPVQVSVTLGHEGEDSCDGLIDLEPSLDLSLLKRAYQDAYQTGTGVIILNIAGYDAPLEYRF